MRLERFGPNLPAALYDWDGRDFGEARLARLLFRRCRKLGLEPPPVIWTVCRRLNFTCITDRPTKRRPCPARRGRLSQEVATGWALEYRPVGGIKIVGDLDTMKLKPGTWSATRSFLWSQGESRLASRSRTFRAEASRDWWQRLRKNKLGRFWQSFDQDKQGPEWMRDEGP